MERFWRYHDNDSCRLVKEDRRFMQITTDEMLKCIGLLYIENIMLRSETQKMENVLVELRTKKEPVEEKP
jgi:hypothetical protein